MYSATHQHTTTPQQLEDVEMGTLSRAETLIDTAARDSATAGDSTAAGESTKTFRRKGQS
jgi:hypothetical protein